MTEGNEGIAMEILANTDKQNLPMLEWPVLKKNSC